MVLVERYSNLKAVPRSDVDLGQPADSVINKPWPVDPLNPPSARLSVEKWGSIAAVIICHRGS